MNPWDIPTVDVAELPAGAVLLDVRNEDEWEAGHIDGAVHVPMSSLQHQMQYEPGPLTPMCRSSSSARSAIEPRT